MVYKKDAGVNDVKQNLIDQIDKFCPLQGSFRDARPAYDDSDTNERWTLNPTREDKHCGSFSVNLVTGVFNDFATGQSGNIIELYSQATGKSFQQIMNDFSDSLHEKQYMPISKINKVPWLNPPDGFSPRLDGKEVPTSVYPYIDTKGSIQFWILRWDRAEGKEIRPAYYGVDKKLHIGIPEHMSKDRPLYRLSELYLRPDAPILVVEGEKSADAAAQLYPNYQVVTWSGGAQLVKKTDFSPLFGRFVYLWPDADEPGIKAMEQIKDLLKAHAKVVLLNIASLEKPTGWDVADLAKEIQGRFTDAEDVLQQLITVSSPCLEKNETHQKGLTSDQDGTKQSQADKLQALVLETKTLELWHDQDQKPYITSSGGQVIGTFPLESKATEQLLQRLWYQNNPMKALSAEPLKTVISFLKARAIFSETMYQSAIRVAGDNQHIYIDLANDDWNVIEITELGWKLKSAFDIPVRFFRTGGMLALPIPQQGGALTDLKQYLNIQDESTWALVTGWLLGCYLPTGAYPILIINGPQGSAKTTMSKILRTLVDPNKAPLRSPPSSSQDLAITANNSWLLAFDNLSHIKDSLADNLCTMATGGGFSTRQLYTNLDETIVSYCRPCLVNGIDNLSNRPDLLDRSIILDLKPISEDSRKTVSDIENLFSHQYPNILGSIYSALTSVLKNLSQIQLQSHPRMADFCRWVIAGEEHIKLKENTFYNYYSVNRNEVIDDAAENDSVVQFVMTLLEGSNPWTGSATELLNIMNDYQGEMKSSRKDWPKNVQGLTGRLRRIQPLLDKHHIRVENSRTNIKRKLIITKLDFSHASNTSGKSKIQNSPTDDEDMGWLKRAQYG